MTKEDRDRAEREQFRGQPLPKIKKHVGAGVPLSRLPRFDRPTITPVSTLPALSGTAATVFEAVLEAMQPAEELGTDGEDYLDLLARIENECALRRANFAPRWLDAS